MEEEKETKVEEGNKLIVRIDSKFFNCHICDRPLKPPVFQVNNHNFMHVNLPYRLTDLMYFILAVLCAADAVVREQKNALVHAT